MEVRSQGRMEGTLQRMVISPEPVLAWISGPPPLTVPVMW